MVLAKERYDIRERELVGATLVAFTAQTRMSGVDFEDRRVRKGAADSVRRWVEDQGGAFPEQLGDAVDAIAAQGGTPLVVAEAGAEGSPPPARARRDLPEGHREARHRRAVRRSPPHGHPHRDDHR